MINGITFDSRMVRARDDARVRATTPSYYPGGAYTANSSVTLYAIWDGAVTPTGAMYHSDGVGVREGEPYIVDNRLLHGTAYVVIGGVLKEGK